MSTSAETNFFEQARRRRQAASLPSRSQAAQAASTNSLTGTLVGEDQSLAADPIIVSQSVVNPQVGPSIRAAVAQMRSGFGLVAGPRQQSQTQAPTRATMRPQTNATAAAAVAATATATAPAPAPVAAPAVMPGAPAPAPASPAAAAVIPAAATASMSPLERLRARAAAAQSEDPVVPDQPWERDDDDDARNAPEQGQKTRMAQAAAQPTVQALEGVVSEIRQYGDWAVANITLDNRHYRRISGAAVSQLKEGARYRVDGVLRQHPQHGESIEVSFAMPVVSADKAALQRYLVKHFDGVGLKKAEQYLQALQEADPSLLKELSQVMVHEPWLLDVRAVLSAQPRVRVQAPAPKDGQQDGQQDGQKGPEAVKEAGGKEGQAREGVNLARLSRVQQAQHKAALQALSRSFMLSFGGTTLLKESQAKALSEHFWNQFGADPDLVNKAMGSFREDPYAPVLSVEGFGFVTADALGRQMGIALDDERRLRVSGAWVAALACARRGHSYIKGAEFVAELRRAMPGASAQGVLNVCAAKKTLVIDPAGGRIYVPKLWLAEQRVASKVAERLRHADPMTNRGYDEVVDFLKAQAHRINKRFASDGLDEGQIHAVAAIMTAPTSLHVLTGGPGTGKTTIMECVVWMLGHRKHFTFAAPTGKAAKVLSHRLQALDVSASTICSLLRGTDEEGYEIDADKPLETDVLVVDESTMVGIEAADALLQAIQSHTHIIFLGDPGLIDEQGAPDKAGQLPSISPGRFMHDLQSIPEVQKLHLSKVFRNGGGILDVVCEVAQGQLEVRDRETVKFEPLPKPGQALQTVIARYLELARRDGMANTVLIMPRRAGDVNEPGWNVTWSNAVLRDILNRDGIKMPGTIYRLGDRIIVRKNIQAPVPTAQDLEGKATTLEAKHLAEIAGIEDPRPAMVYREGDLDAVKQVRLVNGDAGFILGWRMDVNNPRMGQPQWVELLLDDGRRVWLAGEEIAQLDHAYALTVHAVQGSEYRNVLFCATDGGESFMNANMLLTALSRAKSYLHVWGDEGVLKRVAATKLPDRNSGVAEKVALIVVEMDAQARRDSLAQVEECALEAP